MLEEVFLVTRPDAKFIERLLIMVPVDSVEYSKRDNKEKQYLTGLDAKDQCILLISLQPD